VRKRDLISALNLLASALRMPLGHIPADPNWLRRRLTQVVPARLNITKKTWSNTLSNAKAALVCTGVVTIGSRGKQLSAPWRELWDQLDDRNLKISLGRFITFCSREGIQLTAVTDQTVEHFAAVLKVASLRKDPDLALYYLTTSWNKAGERV